MGRGTANRELRFLRELLLNSAFRLQRSDPLRKPQLRFRRIHEVQADDQIGVLLVQFEIDDATDSPNNIRC